MRIGEVAARTDTPIDTIRYYERLGMLPVPARTGSNYRSYSSSQIDRLQFIRRCRSLDMSLAEIRSLLVFCDEPNRYCGEVNGVLDNHIRAVEQRIEELAHLAKELRQLRAVCRAPGTADKCRILQNLRGSSASLPAAARKGRKPSRA